MAKIKRVPVMSRIDEDLKKRAEVAARKERRSLSAIIEIALGEYLDRHGHVAEHDEMEEQR